MKLRSLFVHYLQGLLMGGADVIPGVSGGTMALIVGIYERLIDSISHVFSAVLSLLRLDVARMRVHLRAVHWGLIVPLGLGIGTAIVLASTVILDLLENYPQQMAGLFFGLVLASIAVPWLRIGRFTFALALLAVAGAAAAFWLVGLPLLAQPETAPGLLRVFLSASVAICAMILPGVSGAFLLKVIGMYEPTLAALHDRDVLYVLVFLAGAGVGIGLFSKLLDWLLDHHHDHTMAVLIGLMAGSLRALWPYLEADRGLRLPEPGEPILSVVLLGLLGFTFVAALTWWGSRRLTDAVPLSERPIFWQQTPTGWDNYWTSAGEGRRITDGNRLDHVGGDDEAVASIWECIDKAEESVWLTMYIFEPDEVGHRTIERLAEAARRGCQVLLHYDQAGSLRLKGKDLAPLDEKNAEVAIFHPFWPPWKLRGSPAVRNHRKLVIYDGKAAHCGGMNLSVEFAGDRYGDFKFDDTMCYVEGPCVRDLAELFVQPWRETTGEAPPLPQRVAPFDDGVTVEVLETDPRDPSTRHQDVLAVAIANARVRCYVTSPYFIPAPWLREALINAADAGADVRVLTAGQTDNRVARAAGRHFYDDLFDHGVRIYERTDRILHSKTVTIDGTFGMVGSYNMDLWTTKHVLDLSLTATDEKWASDIEAEFFHNLKVAEEVTPEVWKRQTWRQRLWHCLAWWICKLT